MLVPEREGANWRWNDKKVSVHQGHGQSNLPRRSSGQKTKLGFKLEHGPFVKTPHTTVSDATEKWAARSMLLVCF